MTAILQISIHFSSLNALLHDRSKQKHGSKLTQPINCYSFSRTAISPFRQNSLTSSFYAGRWSFLVGNKCKDGVLVRGEERKRRSRVVLVRFNQGFGFNGGGGGGGGGRDSSATARVLGNLALAIGLTYLSITGQLGWVLDAIVSLWILAFLLPIVGLGAFLWWAGRDIVQSSCPNCGNEFQIFRSAINDDFQLCPFCSQPFSVSDDEFVREPVQFFNESTTFGKEFKNFSSQSKKEKKYSSAVVDVEAEVKDVE